MRIPVLAGTMAFTLFAQAPEIVLIRNAVSYDARLSPGSRAVINHTLAVDDPNSVSVQVGGRPAAILAIAGSALGVQLPVELPPGPTAVVMTSRGISTPPYSITLDAYAPLLLNGPHLIGTYCPALAPAGTRLIAFGLGPTNPSVLAGAEVPASPPASTVVKPSVTVAGRPAEVLASVLAPGRNEGIYHVDLRVPPGIPDGLHPLVLSIGGYEATGQLRVASATTSSAAVALEGRTSPESLMSAYACADPLATGEFAADPRNPPDTLLGTTVLVKDSTGVERRALLLYVSPRQVNYVLPPGTSPGPATVIITSGDGAVSTAAAQVNSIAPALFSVLDSLLPAALVSRTRNGVQSLEPVFRIVNGKVEPEPIDLGPETDEVFLLLFGTGLRGRSELGSVKLFLDSNIPVPVEYTGPHAEFVGLDQVNARLPRSLAGGVRGVWLTVDGEFAAPPDMYLVFR